LPCFSSIAALPAAPDIAFVAVRKEATIEVVRELARCGAGSCVCYAAGFAETGDEGRQLQERLTAVAGDMALVGPNCYGVLNYVDRVALWPSTHGGEPVERGIALVSQSGNIAINLTMTSRSIPIAHVISAGNQAMLEIGDYIVPLVDDPRVTAIGLYMEGLNDIEGFSVAAEYALRKGKPLVAIKVGTSEVAARVTISHTSSLAGADTFYDALFDRLGIIRAHTLTELMETLKLLSLSGPLQGRRIAALSCSGGEAALTADLATTLGLSIPELSQHQTESLQKQLPAFANVSNPLDYNTSIWGDAKALQRCFATMMQGDVDVTLVILDYPRVGAQEWDPTIDAVIGARRQTKSRAMLVSTFPELLPEQIRKRLIDGGIVPLQGLSDALKALAAAAWYNDKRNAVTRLVEGRLRVPALPGLTSAPQLMDEWQSKQALAACGLRIPGGRLVSAAEAPRAAADIGFPVVVKAVGSTLVHKTEMGALVLNVANEAGVARAVDHIAAAVSGVITHFLIEPMIVGAVAELIVGVERDDQVGLGLVVGSGGTLVNLVEDSCTLLLPTDRESVTSALASLKAWRLLTGYRGAPLGDCDAVIDAVLIVAEFTEQHRDRLTELDVNPLLVLPRGQGVVVADAAICMAGTTSE
jgi:acyl-CoA synthetase (NDP forming)